MNSDNTKDFLLAVWTLCVIFSCASIFAGFCWRLFCLAAGYQ